MTEAIKPTSKLNVFISYSRDDLAFSDQLDAALRLTGFDTTIDRRGISGGEDWKSRLGNLIRAADTIVFVLSPSSARSDVCAWEVGEAVRLGKRIIPVLCRPLEGASAPPQLAELNYIFFFNEPKSPGSGFGTGLTQLVAALNTDLDWLREHTRYLQRAAEWEAVGRPANRLLSGSDIATAKAWAASRPKDAPEPTALHLDFIRASEAEETRQQSAEAQRLRQLAEAHAERGKALEEKEAALGREAEQGRRVVRRTLAGLLASLVLAVAATWFGFDARQQKNEAERQRENAQRALANLKIEERRRTSQAFQMGWRALAGLNQRSEEETYEICGAIEGLEGVRRLYCEVDNVLSIQTLATLSGIEVFESGPHVRAGDAGKVNQYNLRSHQIGRYNPAFVAWLGEFAVPAVGNDAFRASTAGLFKQHVEPIALLYHRAYVMLFDPAMREQRLRLTKEFEDNLANYSAEMEYKRRNIRWTNMADYVRFWGTSPSYKLQTALGVFTGEKNLTDAPVGTHDLRIAMSFWVRRSLDGTHRAFFDILRKTLDTYGALPQTPLDLGDG